MRSFLRRLFAACNTVDDFDETNAKHLADELIHEISIAREEWQDIQRNLIKWMAGTTLLSGVGAGVALASPAIFGAAFTAAATTEAAVAWYKKHHFSHKLPAAFFLKLENEVYGGEFFGI